MARGNSKGIVRAKLIATSLERINKAFTASDILDAMYDMNPRPKNIPSIREVGAALRVFVASGQIIELGKAVPNKYRDMVEAAGLWQRGLRKTKLYIKVGDLDKLGDPDER